MGNAFCVSASFQRRASGLNWLSLVALESPLVIFSLVIRSFLSCLSFEFLLVVFSPRLLRSSAASEDRGAATVPGWRRRHRLRNAQKLGTGELMWPV